MWVTSIEDSKHLAALTLQHTTLRLPAPAACASVASPDPGSLPAAPFGT